MLAGLCGVLLQACRRPARSTSIDAAIELDPGEGIVTAVPMEDSAARIQLEKGLEHLPARYRPLFESVRRVLQRDERVRAMWLHGAIARGRADAGSDLDVDIAVADEHFDVFTAA